ncbi:hypothetical protein HK097_007203 [Rhizophlyctis rosea]|uniref:Uncharacterized protein n=1 Tax=Rhizophlyctis rosea TaxID=64517 RepID=A0AAD5SKI1_9FUNG|nr:hypothetical protein HK097_007203 [Rhizophlyctis rosea]
MASETVTDAQTIEPQGSPTADRAEDPLSPSDGNANKAISIRHTAALRPLEASFELLSREVSETLLELTPKRPHINLKASVVAAAVSKAQNSSKQATSPKEVPKEVDPAKEKEESIASAVQEETPKDGSAQTAQPARTPAYRNPNRVLTGGSDKAARLTGEELEKKMTAMKLKNEEIRKKAAEIDEEAAAWQLEETQREERAKAERAAEQQRRVKEREEQRKKREANQAAQEALIREREENAARKAKAMGTREWDQDKKVQESSPSTRDDKRGSWGKSWQHDDRKSSGGRDDGSGGRRYLGGNRGGRGGRGGSEGGPFRDATSPRKESGNSSQQQDEAVADVELANGGDGKWGDS